MNVSAPREKSNVARPVRPSVCRPMFSGTLNDAIGVCGKCVSVVTAFVLRPRIFCFTIIIQYCIQPKTFDPFVSPRLNRDSSTDYHNGPRSISNSSSEREIMCHIENRRVIPRRLNSRLFSTLSLYYSAVAPIKKKKTFTPVCSSGNRFKANYNILVINVFG